MTLTLRQTLECTLIKGNQIFSLITKQQTDASLDLASAAKGDSEAMKVIAIMTMLFLPGTFFATCFAVPTLHWDDQNVISGRFWVYIAFSVPSTVLICIFYMGWPALHRYLPSLALRIRKLLRSPGTP